MREITMDEKLKNVKCFLLDMDGTVYLGDNLIDGAVDAVKRMNERCRALFLTNNSSAAPSDYVCKLRKMGFTVKDDDVFTSGNATIEYLHAHYPRKRVFLFGNDKLFAQFKAGGINLTEEYPDLAVVGFDTTFNYDRLTKLCDFIREGVPYITTHGDINCPTAHGYKPDVGSFIALIEKSTGVSPLLICGKPFSPIAESIQRVLGLNKHEIAMVGDRISTDMQFAINNGFVSVLVLTGEGTVEEAEKAGQKIDVVLKSIADWDK